MMIENYMNVVPNAWLTRKMVVPKASYVNLIITFTMHSLSMLDSFISMKCCLSIGDRNCHSLDYRVEPSSCFLKKVHRVKVKYGSNQLANWSKRWIGLHQFFIYCQHMVVPIKKTWGLLMSMFFQFHFDKTQWTVLF